MTFRLWIFYFFSTSSTLEVADSSGTPTLALVNSGLDEEPEENRQEELEVKFSVENLEEHGLICVDSRIWPFFRKGFEDRFSEKDMRTVLKIVECPSGYSSDLNKLSGSFGVSPESLEMWGRTDLGSLGGERSVEIKEEGNSAEQIKVFGYGSYAEETFLKSGFSLEDTFQIEKEENITPSSSIVMFEFKDADLAQEKVGTRTKEEEIIEKIEKELEVLKPNEEDIRLFERFKKLLLGAYEELGSGVDHLSIKSMLRELLTADEICFAKIKEIMKEYDDEEEVRVEGLFVLAEKRQKDLGQVVERLKSQVGFDLKKYEKLSARLDELVGKARGGIRHNSEGLRELDGFLAGILFSDEIDLKTLEQMIEEHDAD
ncbi:hypothetical protein [Candidatus Mycoplasma haematohominis]|uniref:hypothetical protein n=1 Tax=Candidatus Mycoplasma haematohominis TaxID=1494318 RepID=UPI001C0A69AE|nr:hypothetical protein [Candidatus Mycoplasma haemohominis]